MKRSMIAVFSAGALLLTLTACGPSGSVDAGRDVTMSDSATATDVVASGDASTGIETTHGGRSLGEWMKRYWAQTISGAGMPRDMDVAFLPIPNGTAPDGGSTTVGSANVTIGAADSFALPMFVWVGETYMGGMPADDDVTMPPDSDFTGPGNRIVVSLDGVEIINSTRDMLSRFFFSAQRFDMTIPYPMPGPNRAIGAIWVKGVGFLHRPLSVGTHTLHLEQFSSAAMAGYRNTWTITVN